MTETLVAVGDLLAHLVIPMAYSHNKKMLFKMLLPVSKGLTSPSRGKKCMRTPEQKAASAI